MNLSREVIKEFVRALPGSAVAYHVKQDGIYRLCYTDSVAQLSGYTPEEFAALGEHDIDILIYEPDLKPVMAAVKKGIEDDSEINCTYRVHNKNGQLTQVQARARVIGEIENAPVVLAVVMLVTLESLQFDLLNRVPVGMGIYEVSESGLPSLKYLNDSYFEIMGFKRGERTQFLGENTIKAVHPDDRAAILDGIQASLNVDGDFRATTRMVGSKPDEYHWVLLEGKVAQHTGPITTYYLSFTLVDELMGVHHELEKSRTVLQNAVEAVNLRYFEYYPRLKMALEHDKENYLDTPDRIENYPDAFFEENRFHPDDVDEIRAAYRRIDEGISVSESWDGRLFMDGRYIWHHLTMTALPVDDGEQVVVCTINDITLEKEAKMAYLGHVDSIMRMNPDAISSIRLNLTDNVCVQGFSEYESIHNLVKESSVDDFFTVAATNIPDDEERSRFLEMFDRTKMMEAFGKGDSRYAFEHRYLLEKDHLEWVQTNVDLIRNPVTGKMEAVLYTLNITQRHIEDLVVSGLIEQAYDAIGIINLKTDEFFLFDRLHNIFGEHRQGFPKANEVILNHFMTDKEWARKHDAIAAEEVKAQLEQTERYDVTFFSNTDEGLKRKQVSYFYVDRERGTIMATIRDFTDKNLLERFRYASRHDPVTGLYNRVTTFERCRYIIDAHPDDQLVMCHFDIKKFRLLNSFYGEAEGNKLLDGLARLFEELASEYEYASYGRIDADVFCMCYPLIDDLMRKDIRSVRAYLADYLDDFFLAGRFGIYKITDPTMPVEAMFERAAIAAKNIKPSASSNHLRYNDAMEHEFQREQRINNEMQAAINHNQFKVYLQPKVDLTDEHPCGAEALVRWEHPVHGMVSPGDFIPLFETNGFITKLDHFMWEGVCKLLRRWIDAGYEPLPISVNVSRVSMYSAGTVGFLNDLIKKYDIPAHLMQLELTESAYMDNPTEMHARVEQLRQDGFPILMDDFGSGYSSLNTLKNLAVDYLKIDTEFLSSAEDERSRLVLSSVITMAHQLDLPVIVEGVETTEQRDYLRDMSCEYAQGYLFARPMPAETFEQTIVATSA